MTNITSYGRCGIMCKILKKTSLREAKKAWFAGKDMAKKLGY